MSVLASFLPTAYFSNTQLHHLVACQMVILTLRHGLTSASTMGLTAYGFELVITRKQYARAARFARVALARVERHGSSRMRRRCACSGASSSSPGSSGALPLHLHRAGPARWKGAGDVVFVGLGYPPLPAVAGRGERLEEVERAARAAADFTRGVGNEPLRICVESVQRFTRALRGRPPAFPLEARGGGLRRAGEPQPAVRQLATASTASSSTSSWATAPPRSPKRATALRPHRLPTGPGR